jgi:hypothetical protein
MKSKVYLSKKFYVGRPFSDLDPEVELSGLNSLKKMLLENEAYEKVRLVQNRLDELELEMQQPKQQITYNYGTN